MAPDQSRAAILGGTLGLGAAAVWAAVDGQPVPVLVFLVVATVVGAVGVSAAIAEVASWYYVLQSALLGTFGVGLLLLGYDTPLVVGLTAAFVFTGLYAAVSYRRARQTVSPPEEKTS